MIFIEIFYLLFSVFPIIMYLFWRRGYNLQKFKIPISSSSFLALCIYIVNFEVYAILPEFQYNLIQKISYFLLLFFSLISIIIILSIPNNQNQEKGVINDTYYCEQLAADKDKRRKKNQAGLSGESNRLLVDNYISEHKDKDTETVNSLDGVEDFMDDLLLNEVNILKPENRTIEHIVKEKKRPDSFTGLQELINKLYKSQNKSD